MDNQLDRLKQQDRIEYKIDMNQSYLEYLRVYIFAIGTLMMSMFIESIILWGIVYIFIMIISIKNIIKINKERTEIFTRYFDFEIKPRGNKK